MDIECEHCGNVFSSKTNLVVHQKTSKRCLGKRGEYGVEYACEDCEKLFSQKSTLSRHQKTCKLRAARLAYEDKLGELEADNKKLKEDLKEMTRWRDDLEFIVDHFANEETYTIEESVKILNKAQSRHLFFINKTHTATE